MTSSPVYDQATGDVYLVAQVVQAPGPAYYLFGVNPGTGAVVFKRSIGGAATNDPHITFNASNQLARPGLLLMNGWIYAAFGSHCDHSPYVGFVDGVKVSNGALTEWSDETGVSDNQAGIWQGGAGVMSDGAGRIFVTSGNGISPAAGPGTRPSGQLAESVIQLSVRSGGALVAKDFFSPADAPSLDAGDVDFGSGGPLGLPFGTSTYPHVLAQAGKDGRIFLLDRDNLGGRKQGSQHGDDVLNVTHPYFGQWGHPAVFAHTTTLSASNAGAANDYLYYIGTNDSLRVLKFGVNQSDQPTLSDVANSSLVVRPDVRVTGRDFHRARHLDRGRVGGALGEASAAPTAPSKRSPPTRDHAAAPRHRARSGRSGRHRSVPLASTRTWPPPPGWST